ncbi:YDG domain-containing protein At5g47160-like [Brassica napus]|nr:YDG domain-containing protein At5g47160-like [Brassica napus]
MERDLCPREKVSKARRLFKIIFKELLVDVEAKRTTRIDHDVRMMLKEQNMCVNTDYRVGEVPGILVGDEFEYKTEMSVVGLHFGIMSGIDCQEMRTGLIFATSIVASEGSQYRNVFKGDQLLYSGVGKGLLKGNMALVNNMKHKAPVRVIRGTIHHGNKQMFVYLGLYLVKSYERGAEGCFQFLLETA